MSDYERAHPVVAKGINLGILRLSSEQAGAPGRLPRRSISGADLFIRDGAVRAGTDTDAVQLCSAWSTQIRKEFHDPNPRATPTPSPTPNSLEEIATVYAHNRDYTITLLGTDTIDGHACYHLGLTPTRDPGRYRIRQAWIDEQTFATWQLARRLELHERPRYKRCLDDPLRRCRRRTLRS